MISAAFFQTIYAFVVNILTQADAGADAIEIVKSVFEMIINLFAK